jgi:hypothetical protein
MLLNTNVLLAQKMAICSMGRRVSDQAFRVCCSARSDLKRSPGPLTGRPSPPFAASEQPWQSYRRGEFRIVVDWFHLLPVCFHGFGMQYASAAAISPSRLLRNRTGKAGMRVVELTNG